MQIIPCINCLDPRCLDERIKKLENIQSDWLHIDISDGKFTQVLTWNKPEELKTKLNAYNLEPNIEVHLMVKNPEIEIDKWIQIGVKRIIIHLEAIKNENGGRVLNSILEKCSEHDVELGLALNPETSVDELIPYLDSFLFVQILAVKPGFSGQKFDKNVIEKIEFLRERMSDIDIEIDGGIDLETVKLAVQAGANIFVSASYIFEGSNPLGAYKNLKLAAKAI